MIHLKRAFLNADVLSVTGKNKGCDCYSQEKTRSWDMTDCWYHPYEKKPTKTQICTQPFLLDVEITYWIICNNKYFVFFEISSKREIYSTLQTSESNKTRVSNTLFVWASLNIIYSYVITKYSSLLDHSRHWWKYFCLKHFCLKW